MSIRGQNFFFTWDELAAAGATSGDLIAQSTIPFSQFSVHKAYADPHQALDCFWVIDETNTATWMVEIHGTEIVPSCSFAELEERYTAWKAKQ